MMTKTASAESPWRKIGSFFRYFALVLPPSAWDRKDSRTKGCCLLFFTDKVPRWTRLIRAASESDRVVSAISSSGARDCRLQRQGMMGLFLFTPRLLSAGVRRVALSAGLARFSAKYFVLSNL